MKHITQMMTIMERVQRVELMQFTTKDDEVTWYNFHTHANHEKSEVNLL